MIWQQSEGWTYEYFEPYVEPSEFPGFEDLVHLYQGKTRGRRTPGWSDFDFLEFKGWHGKIAVYDISYDPYNYAFRLAGGDFDVAYGQSMTGVTGSELQAGMCEYPMAMDFSEYICRELFIGRVTGPINWKGREHVEAVFLEFPLSEDGGKASQTFEALLIDI